MPSRPPLHGGSKGNKVTVSHSLGEPGIPSVTPRFPFTPAVRIRMVRCRFINEIGMLPCERTFFLLPFSFVSYFSLMISKRFRLFKSDTSVSTNNNFQNQLSNASINTTINEALTPKNADHVHDNRSRSQSQCGDREARAAKGESGVGLGYHRGSAVNETRHKSVSLASNN